VVDPPPTDPDPGPSDPPVGPPALVDAVALGAIKWMESGNFASWPIEHSLSVRREGNIIKLDEAPPWTQTVNVSGKLLAGNFWIGIRDDGHVWEMCPYEWFYPGQDWCAINVPWHEGHLCPHMSRGPNRGEEVLLMVSTCARCLVRSPHSARSNIIKFQW